MPYYEGDTLTAAEIAHCMNGGWKLAVPPVYAGERRHRTGSKTVPVFLALFDIGQEPAIKRDRRRAATSK